MSRKTRMLFAAWLAAGLFCIAVMAMSLYPSLGRRLIRPDFGRYGELYEKCRITHFKIPLNEELHESLWGKKNDRPAEDAAIIFCGDSFFGNYMGGLFEKFTGVPSYYIKFRAGYATPVSELVKLRFKRNTTTRYVVYEKVDRVVGMYDITPEFRYRPGKTNINTYIKRHMLNPLRIEYLVEENPLMDRLLEIRNTSRFNVFREIGSYIPVYSLDPPMIYGSRDVDFGRFENTDQFIEKQAGRIAEVDKELMDMYGLKLIFVPIPNKYALYGYDYNRFRYNVSGEKYDDFLPRLYKALDERGVLYIDLYHEYKERKVPMYAPTQGHWNDEAKKIFIARLYELYEREERLRADGAAKEIEP